MLGVQGIETFKMLMCHSRILCGLGGLLSDLPLMGINDDPVGWENPFGGGSLVDRQCSSGKSHHLMARNSQGTLVKGKRKNENRSLASAQIYAM